MPACFACQAPNATKTCGRCGWVKYCSVKCQQTQWSTHKTMCLRRHRDKCGLGSTPVSCSMCHGLVKYCCEAHRQRDNGHIHCARVQAVVGDTEMQVPYRMCLLARLEGQSEPYAAYVIKLVAFLLKECRWVSDASTNQVEQTSQNLRAYLQSRGHALPPGTSSQANILKPMNKGLSINRADRADPLDNTRADCVGSLDHNRVDRAHFLDETRADRVGFLNNNRADRADHPDENRAKRKPRRKEPKRGAFLGACVFKPGDPGDLAQFSFGRSSTTSPTTRPPIPAAAIPEGAHRVYGDTDSLMVSLPTPPKPRLKTTAILGCGRHLERYDIRQSQPWSGKRGQRRSKNVWLEELKAGKGGCHEHEGCFTFGTADVCPDGVWDLTTPLPSILHGLFDRVRVERITPATAVNLVLLLNARWLLVPGGRFEMDLPIMDAKLGLDANIRRVAVRAGLRPGFWLPVTPCHVIQFEATLGQAEGNLVRGWMEEFLEAIGFEEVTVRLHQGPEPDNGRIVPGGMTMCRARRPLE